jgi:hypothetical protein
MENFYNYQTKTKRDNYTLQKNVEQKGGGFHFRADYELTKYIKELSKGLNHSVSKVIKDILEDFFLEQKLREQKEDVEHFLKNT